MEKIVISQPMFFPWVGLFEEIRLADTYVHLDDVQLPQGRSFLSRVQVKTPSGSRWLTVPIRRKNLGPQIIRDVLTDDSQDWRGAHLKTLSRCYSKAPFFPEMISMVESVYSSGSSSLCEMNIASIEMISGYFGLERRFLRSSLLEVPSSGSEKIFSLVRKLGGDAYITGHGARNYLDHALFEESGIRVEYMNYERAPYPQLHGGFDPHVTILDLIANAGRDGIRWIRSGTIHWREFFEHHSK